MDAVTEFAPHRTWADEELELARRDAIAAFIEERSAEGTARYRANFAGALEKVERLFAATDDLRALGTGQALADDPPLVELARYFAAPPVSRDDLNTLAGANVATRRRLDVHLGLKAAEVILSAVDPERFPWLFEDPPRAPSDAERTMALRWTSGVKASAETSTGRRGESSTRQEAAVRQLLTNHGFVQVPARPVDVTGAPLQPGQFMREALVVGIKCDVPVALRDGRLLLLECKVSNSATNSVKRLNRETGGKARDWNRQFGERAITGAVLAGVFKLRNLKTAQAGGVAIYWEQDLDALAAFMEAATP